jgi:hypothetical protein
MNILYSAFLFTVAHGHGLRTGLRTRNLEDTNPSTPDYYCDWGNGYEQENNTFCHTNQDQCEGQCNGDWVDVNSSLFSHRIL